MSPTAKRKPDFWRIAADKLCELRGIAPDQRVRVRQPDGSFSETGKCAHDAAVIELRNLHMLVDALEYADDMECRYCKELNGHAKDCDRPVEDAEQNAAEKEQK